MSRLPTPSAFSRPLLALPALLIALLSSLGASGALAADAPPNHKLYVAISPIHLALPVVEVTGELQISPQIGVAAVLGAGNVSDVKLFEVGAQGIWYPIGDFNHGMQIGAEALFTGGGTSSSADGEEVTASAAGLAVGPFVGYKLATNVGFSFNIQAGAQYLTLAAKASSVSGASASKSESDLIPMLNLNVGWSF